MQNETLRALDVAERLANLAEARLKGAVAELGLQAAHARILLYLAAANRYSNTPQAVTDYLGVTKGTVSQSLILLEGKGLLERVQDDRDRRVVRLALTPAGRQVCAHVARDGLERFGAACRLPAGLVDGLLGMLRCLQEQEGRRGFGVCRSCRHHTAAGRGYWRCGLTGERLLAAERERICREHEAVSSDAIAG
ncbi:MAG: MarR family winged helix-turn-helix transcriptional regulator [Rhodocyclaceae bacterium]